MPFIHVSSNVSMASVNAGTAIRELSKTACVAMGAPEKAVMVKLDLETLMLFQGSDAPCAFISVRYIGNIDSEHNPKTAKALTETVSEVLNVPADRVFLNLEDIPAGNWAFAGNILG